MAEFDRGATAEEIVYRYPALKLSDVYSSLPSNQRTISFDGVNQCFETQTLSISGFAAFVFSHLVLADVESKEVKSSRGMSYTSFSLTEGLKLTPMGQVSPLLLLQLLHLSDSQIAPFTWS